MNGLELDDFEMPEEFSFGEPLEIAEIPEELQGEILQRRSQELARPLVLNESVEASLDIAEFHLAEHRFGFELEQLKEVYTVGERTHIPCCPPFVAAVINLRGQIVTIIDLLSLLDIRKSDKQEVGFDKVLVFKHKQFNAGIFISEVIGARKIPLSSIKKDLFSSNDDHRFTYIKGVTKERLLILDVFKLLDHPKLLKLRSVE